MNNYRQLAALHLNDAASFRLLGAYRMARLSIDAARKANARRKMLEFDFSALEAPHLGRVVHCVGRVCRQLFQTRHYHGSINPRRAKLRGAAPPRHSH